MPSALTTTHSSGPQPSTSRPSKRLVVFCDGTWVGRETQVAGAPASNIRQLANMVGEVQFDDTTEPAKVYPIHPHLVTHSLKSKSALTTTQPATLVESLIPSSSVVKTIEDDSSVTSSTADYLATTTVPPSIVAGYQEGAGINGTFLEYIWDGATAAAISEECINAYKFIVENYTSDHEISLFGFSRGAFTVRCVAGMINNCGIIRRRPEYTEDEVKQLCYEVFRTYRSALSTDAPQSATCRRLRADASRVWPVSRPIRFMGIIDTVGALGIPHLSAGVGFDWAPLEFFDQRISSVVQYVYHAPSVHDRLWIFQPCLVFPSTGHEQAVVKQKWFPGTHYDLGRMTFRFVRQNPTSWLEKVIGVLPDLLSRTIYPNEILSDTVLRWMLEGIHDTDDGSANPIIPNLSAEILTLTNRITNPAPNTTGSGDIYGDVLAYAPGGVVISAFRRVASSFTTLLNRVVPFPNFGDRLRDLLGIKTIMGILLATSDRRIPDGTGDVYPYMFEEIGTAGGVFSVEQQANMSSQNDRGKKRYLSRTFESMMLWRRVFGVRNDEGDRTD